MPKIYIIAGSNGAGKTTFAREFLPHYAHCPHFINADLIASGLSPFLPASARIKAGRLLLGQIQAFIDKREDFAIESTLSGRTYISIIQKIKRSGYSVHIFFLWIQSTGLAEARIKERVKGGGHDVPSKDVKRRFGRSLHNFLEFYKPLSDSWILFDNSSEKPVLVAEKEKDLVVVEPELFQNITKGYTL